MRVWLADFRASGIRTLFIGFVLLGVIVVGTTILVRSEGHSTLLVRQTLDAETDLYRLLSLLQDAETGQRGYLLTRDDAYLVPYRRAVATIDQAFDSLAMPADPQLMQAVTALRMIAHDKLDELKTTIEDARQGRVQQALAIVNSGAGKSFMDQARDAIARLMAEEDRRLVAEQADASRTASLLQISVVVAAVLLLGLGVFTLQLMTRQLRDVRGAGEKLRAVHDQLVAGSGAARTHRRTIPPGTEDGGYRPTDRRPRA